MPKKKQAPEKLKRNNKEKLLALIRILQEETDAERGLTMPQIIERLEAQGLAAERKALYRDVESLSEAGFNVQKLPTRPVQYALVRSELGFDDVMMLIDVVQSSPFLTERKSNHLVRSLKGLVSARERKLLERRVHVAGRIRNQTESVFHSVDRIHEAIQLKRKLEFLYFSYDTEKNRVPRHDGRLYEVTPVRVVFSDNNYYLVAHDEADEKIKTYRVDRMQIAQVSDSPATRSQDIATFDLDAFGYERFGMFSGVQKTVTLRVEAELMDAIIDRFGREVEVVRSTADHADVRVNVEVSPQFFGWIAGLDGHVTLRTPKKVVDEYHAWLKTLA